jgi:hypothetical protein
MGAAALVPLLALSFQLVSIGNRGAGQILLEDFDLIYRGGGLV